VVATRVGYAGGSMQRPTYHRVGDHLEAVEVLYDPRRVTYEELLAFFWATHPTTGLPSPSRVREAVLVGGDEQRRLALASRRQVARREGQPLSTQVLPLGTFWPAEPMHQKFNLQRAAPRLVDEQADGHGGRLAFLASPLAARLNAYAGGFAGERTLREAAAALGTTPEALRRRLRPTEGETPP
jgi:peptide-methionine (S)-S-oxide reductase